MIEQIKEEVLKAINEYKETSNDHYDFWNEHIKYVYYESIELAKKYNADIEIVSLGALLHDIALIKGGTKEKHHIETFKDTSFKDNPNLINMVNLAPWAKLYNKKLFENESIRFPEDIKYEDVNFVIKAFKEAKTIGKINEYLIYYFVDNVSETLIVNDKVFDIFKICSFFIHR